METIPQRELRNNVGEVLRRAERGERFTVTVGGRPVAELGPLSHPAGFASLERLRRLLADTPVDAEWPEDLRRMRENDRAAAIDPWRE
jgi:prevent-host-death family protein